MQQETPDVGSKALEAQSTDVVIGGAAASAAIIDVANKIPEPVD